MHTFWCAVLPSHVFDPGRQAGALAHERLPRDDEEVLDREARIEALVREGRHADAAELLAATGEYARAAELYAAVWRWDEAIAVTEQAALFDLAYGHALEAGDRAAGGRLLARLEERPEQAMRAAMHAEQKGQLLDAARLREAAGETEAAAALYERAGELRLAAHVRLALGHTREAGVLFERRLKEDPGDAESALELGRILAQFGRWDHAVRALQRAAESPEHELAALKLLVACFAAMGMAEAAGSRLDALRVLEPTLPLTVPAFLRQTYGDERGIAALAGESERMLGGRYRIVRGLGAGATGRVLLARDAFHERDVAVKVLDVGGGSAGRDAFVRFAREARVAAGISHPNVVRVFEFNPDGPFLVMEYMVGGTLEERLVGPDDTPHAYPPPQTWLLAKSVLSALEAVHRRGVVHRDLKPANIFFGEASNIKLGDFGVAHLTDLGATLTGALVGTLAYMSPEQITGEANPGAAADLYSFGVILFRCLTGRLPFEGPDFVAQHLDVTPPRVSDVAPWLGEAFDAPIAKLLTKDPGARFASADELLGALEPLPWSALESVPAPRLPAKASSEPPPAPTEDRYRVIGPLASGVTLAEDELLERKVELVALDGAALEGGLTERLRAFARADGPYLQAVYEVDEDRGRAVLEHPSGEPFDRIAGHDPRRTTAAQHIREALKQLHAERVVHGAVDPAHVVVGRARACLRIHLGPSHADAALDWSGLDALEGRGPARP